MIKEEILKLLDQKLELYTLNEEVTKDFYAAILRYLDRGRIEDDKLKGRTFNFLSDKLDKVILLYTSMGLSNADVVKSLTKMPGLLNVADDLYSKYLLLGVIEDENNNVRRNKFVISSNDLIVGLKNIYARYKLIAYSGYNKFTWHILIHSSEHEFAKVFVKKTKYKKYQIFDTEEDVCTWLLNTEFDFNIEDFKELDVNKEVVEKYEEGRLKY